MDISTKYVMHDSYQCLREHKLKQLQYNFRTFFGVEEGKDGLTWLPGQERVPENWVRIDSCNFTKKLTRA